MGAAREQLHLYQGQLSPALKGLISGHGGLGPGHRLVKHKYLLFLLVLAQEVLHLPRRWPGCAQGDAEVTLGQLVVTDFIVDDAQGLGIFGGDNDAAGIAVDAVAQGRGKGVFPPGIPLPLLVEIRLNVVYKGVHLLRFVRMDHQARLLIQQHKVLVLIHDVKAWLKEGEEHIFLPGLVKKLIIYIQLQHIPLAQPLIPGSPLSVDLDAL